MKTPIQGASLLATPPKQDGLVGIYDTLTTMRKGHYAPVVYFDLYCGSGMNYVGEEVINGSPLSMLEGIRLSLSRMNTLPNQPRRLVFNDIMADRALSRLPMAVEQWQANQGLPVNRDMFICYSKTGAPFEVPIYYNSESATEVVDKIERSIKNGWHTIVAVDPNGPKDAPWKGLKTVAEKYKKRVELIIHISATTLKRIANSRAVTGKEFAPMPDHVADMLAHFGNAGGWIREPVGADQWTMMLISQFPPRNGWNTKTGPKFFTVESEQGRNTIHHLSTTVKQRKAS